MASWYAYSQRCDRFRLCRELDRNRNIAGLSVPVQPICSRRNKLEFACNTIYWQIYVSPVRSTITAEYICVTAYRIIPVGKEEQERKIAQGIMDKERKGRYMDKNLFSLREVRKIRVLLKRKKKVDVDRPFGRTKTPAIMIHVNRVNQYESRHNGQSNTLTFRTGNLVA